jgi:uncharacterized protein
MPLFDLKALENDFKQESVKQSFDGLYQCLGFITAIASSPDQVKPSEWIKQLMTCEDKSPQFESEAQAKTFSGNLVSWWSRCITIFDHEGTLELPTKLGLTPSGKANKSLAEFSSGYLKGFSWLSQTWETMLPKDNLEGSRSLSVLNAILARFVDEKAATKAQPEFYQQLPDMAGCVKVLPNLLSAVGMLGKDLSSSKSEDNKSERITRSPTKNETRSIGRNDPCPCGSGKKFKKCCLH